MDIRKVQMSGGSSYIVSLPKNWVIKSRIKKNDPVGLIEQDDGTILITPNTSGEQIRKIWKFEVSASTDETYFLRCMIGAYISGYTVMRIWAHGRLPAFATVKVREFTSMAIGQEVVDETDSTIEIKDLLNPSEMPLNSTLSRMSVIVIKMHQDAMNALKENDHNLADNVILRDNDVDRLHWLIARQSNLLLNDLNLGRKMEIPNDMAVSYFLTSRIIERVGDHAGRIAKNSKYINSGDISPELTEQISKTSTEAVDIFRNSISSFFNGDIKTANKLIDMAGKNVGVCREINDIALTYDASVATHLVGISDSMRRVADYSADICENVINHFI
ncbi:phosphate uptake regulator PhoU [Methanoplanus endosymbiosus]|uniref:Phosphate uptake regulator PhoU n=1 Tax=Methanoplanus endosymbiosus TaxID=33865 RepID=A0A9E7TH97_9EURY|nr:phosphate uptake regulator PhoU [Methanoplanus endosymbiosus]UUX92442.1 phosphate uptake regulator PhoU [Methanoplanus endosymbiosus]